MKVKKRNKPGDPLMTPGFCVDFLLNRIQLRYPVLEPCSGTGRVVKRLIRRLEADVIDATSSLFDLEVFMKRKTLIRRLFVVANDINPKYSKIAEKLGVKTYNRDFLDINPNPIFSTVITNPPFSLAEEFVWQGLEFLKPGGQLLYFLPITFLGSKKRKQSGVVDKRSGLKHIYILPERPSFYAGKTDMTVYMWACWEKGYKGGWSGEHLGLRKKKEK